MAILTSAHCLPFDHDFKPSLVQGLVCEDESHVHCFNFCLLSFALLPFSPSSSLSSVNVMHGMHLHLLNHVTLGSPSSSLSVSLTCRTCQHLHGSVTSSSPSSLSVNGELSHMVDELSHTVNDKPCTGDEPPVSMADEGAGVGLAADVGSSAEAEVSTGAGEVEARAGTGEVMVPATAGKVKGVVEAAATAGGVEATVAAGGVRAMVASGGVEVAVTAGGIEAVVTAGEVRAVDVGNMVVVVAMGSKGPGVSTVPAMPLEAEPAVAEDTRGAQSADTG